MKPQRLSFTGRSLWIGARDRHGTMYSSYNSRTCEHRLKFVTLDISGPKGTISSYQGVMRVSGPKRKGETK